MAVESLTWVTAAGVEVAWPTQLLRGMSGRGLPPIEVVTRQVPQRAGTVRVSARHLERRVKVPLLLDGDVLTHRTLLRTWANNLDALDGVGKLRFGLVDGGQREIEASVVGGLELSEDTAWMTLADVEFACHDPYFRDTADSSQSAAQGTTSGLFFPLPPLYLAASEIAAEMVVDNTGDVETWPVIAVTGPATGVTVRNATTGKVLALSGTVGAGEVVTLDSRPGRKTVLRQDGLNLYPSLTSRQWFALGEGQTRIRLEATLTTAATLITVSWRRLWKTI